MDDELVRGVVRILDAAGGSAGTGFLLTADGLVASCAHVIGDRDEVDLVFFGSSAIHRATVEPAYLRPASAEDVAFLRLRDAVPEGISPMVLGTSATALGRTVRSFGYPLSAQSAGMWGSGTVVGATKQDGHPVLQLAGGSEITRGFSGAPVMDLATRHVIGMISSITAADEYGRQTETVFLTPAETLRQICPRVALVETPVGGLFLKGMAGDPLPPLRDRAARQSDLWLRENTRARRYIPAVFGARPAMQAAVTDFLDGNHTGFVLTGESGIGKTVLLCHFLEQWRRNGELVLAFHAQSLEIETSLEERILLDLRLSADFMDLIDFLQAAGRRLILVVDGVNEHEAAPRLLRQLSTFIQRYAGSPTGGRPCLKVLLTFRTLFLDKLIEGLPVADRDEALLFPDFAFMHREIQAADPGEPSGQRTRYRFELGGMSLEEIGAAYEAYRDYRESPGATQRHRPSTPFSDIGPDWHPVLANPFYLRLLVEAYHGRAIPARPWQGEIMRAFCELKIWGTERDGNRYAARAALVDELVSLMRQQQTAVFRKETLLTLSPQWERALRADPPAGSPYLQLLEEGVLMESTVREPSGRGARTRSLIRFSFDTLFEYLLGDDMLKEAGGWAQLEGVQLARELERSEHFPYLAGAVEHLVLEAVDACNFMPFIELFGALDAGLRDDVYEALSPQFTMTEFPFGKSLFYDRTGTPELFARLRGGLFIQRLLWQLYEWGDKVSVPLSTVAGPARGRGRPSRWHRNFKRLFEAIEAGADPRAAFNIVLWMAGRAGLMKDDQLTPLCQGTAYRIRAHRIDPDSDERTAGDARAAVFLIQAQALADADSLDAAIDMASQAVGRLEALAHHTPALKGPLAAALIQLAGMHGRAGHLHETIEQADAAARLLRNLPPTTPRDKELLLNALAFQRQARLGADPDAEVEDLVAERVDLLRALVVSHEVLDYLPHLVNGLLELSVCAALRDDQARALDHATEAVEVCRSGLAQPDPDTPASAELADLLPRALVLQGAAFKGAGDPGAAYQAFADAIELWGPLIKDGGEAIVRLVIMALTDRCKLCAALERWDLVGVDVTAAFQLYFDACQQEPAVAVAEVFARLLTWLGRRRGEDQACLYEALGPDNAEVVKNFIPSSTQDTV